ncbi:MAG: DUF2235 domain-containing protein [Deltaproteobacteria bacterium]|nr:DUF2235 domain-containing protein [Deltaproteobacteria bacterium]
MALYAFDGTWNENRPDDAEDTNVFKFKEAYQAKKFYLPGIGTRFGVIGRIVGGFFGAGGKQRINEAYEELEKNFREGDRVIDIIGFSRGGALALDFANNIHSEGVLGTQHPEIRFLGVWDVVPSFGIPGNDINLGYVLTLPDSVKKCFHAMALDERRQNFGVQRIVTTVSNANTEGRIYEVWFRGVHSDIGGGNRNLGLSSIALHWMYKQALRCGLPIPQQEVAKQRENMRPDTEISKNMDIIPNRYRTISWSDVVHESVSHRPDANNPPKDLKVVNDDGQILSRGFGQ